MSEDATDEATRLVWWTMWQYDTIDNRCAFRSLFDDKTNTNFIDRLAQLWIPDTHSSLASAASYPSDLEPQVDKNSMKRRVRFVSSLTIISSKKSSSSDRNGYLMISYKRPWERADRRIDLTRLAFVPRQSISNYRSCLSGKDRFAVVKPRKSLVENYERWSFNWEHAKRERSLQTVHLEH